MRYGCEKKIKAIGFINTLLLPAVVAGVVSIITGILIFNYQKRIEYEIDTKPFLKIHDFTEQAELLEDPRKALFFNLAGRNTTIHKIILHVKNKKLDQLYEISKIPGRGGGFDDSKIYVAFVRIIEQSKDYILHNLKQGVNKFRKDSLPLNVYYHANVANDFFKINLYQDPSLQEKGISLLSTVSAKILYSDFEVNSSNKIRSKKTKKHQFYHINSIPFVKILPNNIKEITINNLHGYREILDGFFERYGNNVKINYIKDEKDKFILFNTGLKLFLKEKFSNDYILNFYKQNG
ncbi:MAG: hypothetical protein D3924_08675 [Candidatus Electrothrix sp. AR4]|nr:hypothetical protein [Candidatus Electrothrix sp. AR4]